MTHALHFLVDASLPRATVSLIQSAGHQATDVRDIGLGTADDQQIADHARTNHLCLITLLGARLVIVEAARIRVRPPP